MFGSCFLKLFLRTLFENTENTILVLSKNLSCYLNIMFSVFFYVFQNKKKLGTKHILHVFVVLFVF